MKTKQKRKWKTTWHFHCSGRDEEHGCFSADFDGVCSAYFNKRTYLTKESVERAAKRHEAVCRFRGETSVRSERKLVPI